MPLTAECVGADCGVHYNVQVLAAVYGPHDMRDSRLRPQVDKVTVNCQYSMAVFRCGCDGIGSCVQCTATQNNGYSPTTR